MIPAFRETVFESLLLVIVIAVLAGGCDTSGDISSEEYK
jgi:hypothetical protein